MTQFARPALALAFSLALALTLQACDDSPSTPPDTPNAPSLSEVQRAYVDARGALRAHVFDPASRRCTPTWRVNRLRERAQKLEEALDARLQGAPGDAVPGIDPLLTMARDLGHDIQTIQEVDADLDAWRRRAGKARRELGQLVHSLDPRYRAARDTHPERADALEASRQDLLALFRETNPDWRTIQQIFDDPLPRDCLGLARAVERIERTHKRAKGVLDAQKRLLDNLGA